MRVAAWMLLAALGACGDLPRPFQPDVKLMPVVRPVSPEAAALMRETQSIAIQPIANLPAQGGERLAAAMAVALRNEGIAAELDPQDPILTLAGVANAREVPNELEVKITWYLLDGKGMRLTQQDQATRGRVEDWIDGNDRLISRIAQTQAKLVAAMINQQTARAGAPRPAAAPTSNLPAYLPAPAPTVLQANGVPLAPPEKPSASDRNPARPGVVAQSAPAANAPPAQQQQIAARAPTMAQVRVVVPRVTGAPGDGPESLAAGMKRALGRRNFAIVAKPEPDSLTVRGNVSLKPFNNNREVITITWAVLDAQNNQIGEIEQSNVIPAGSLSGEWGPIAREITVAAAEGLLELLDKASRAAREQR